MESDDRRWVERARSGDRAAFRELVRLYQRRVYGLAYGMLRHPEDAMDVTQEAFIKVFKHLPDFQGGSAFYTWLYRITFNLCIDHRRRRAGKVQVEYQDTLDHERAPGDAGDLLPSTLGFSPAQELERRETRARIEQALAELPEIHRAILVLREVDGLSYEELAEALGIAKGTVMSRLFHARKKMQRLLGDYAGRAAEPGATRATRDDEPDGEPSGEREAS